MTVRFGIKMFFFASPDANASRHESAGATRPDANDFSSRAAHRSIAQRRATTARRSTLPATDWIDVGMVF
jgi:hypothetical protein